MNYRNEPTRSKWHETRSRCSRRETRAFFPESARARCLESESSLVSGSSVNTNFTKYPASNVTNVAAGQRPTRYSLEQSVTGPVSRLAGSIVVGDVCIVARPGRINLNFRTGINMQLTPFGRKGPRFRDAGLCYENFACYRSLSICLIRERRGRRGIVEYFGGVFVILLILKFTSF